MEEQYDFYNYIKNFLINISPDYKNIINILATKYYPSEDNLKEDINNLNISGLYDRFFVDRISSDSTINVSLTDKYLNKKKEVLINDTKYLIPLYNSQYTVSNYTIKISCKEDNLFKEIDNHLLVVQSISLYKYLYGGNLIFNHLDGEQISVEFKNFIDSVPIIELKNKGLPYLYDNRIVRGNLYVYFVIEGINDNNNGGYNDKVKEVIHKLFY